MLFVDRCQQRYVTGSEAGCPVLQARKTKEIRKLAKARNKQHCMRGRDCETVTSSRSNEIADLIQSLDGLEALIFVA
jgi:hypothetical protein